MKRREFLMRSGAAIASFGVAGANRPESVPRIGFLGLTSADPFRTQLAAFREGLRGRGFVEGKNVRVVYRWADGDPARLPALAAELVQLGPVVIVTSGGPKPARAALVATRTIPIVASSASYSVSSFARPGGNLTGAATQTAALTPKRLELLHQAVPGAARIAILANPANATFAATLSGVTAAARSLKLSLIETAARTAADFDAAFAAMVQRQAQALLVMPDPFLFAHHSAIVALALRDKLPAIYEWGEIAQDGGLMAYGDSLHALYYRVGDYAGRILLGAKPADLPLDEPAAIRLVVNLKTAKAIGFTFPPQILARADEIVE